MGRWACNVPGEVEEKEKGEEEVKDNQAVLSSPPLHRETMREEGRRKSADTKRGRWTRELRIR